MPNSELKAILNHAATKAREAGVFGAIKFEGGEEGMLVCEAKASAAPAQYRLFAEGGKVWVALVTADRWLSESIESELVETGDKLEELLEDELVDLGYDEGTLSFEHFRSEDKLFTFRSPLPIHLGGDSQKAAAVAATCLLAYEQCFRALGDMEDDGEE